MKNPGRIATAMTKMTFKVCLKKKKRHVLGFFFFKKRKTYEKGHIVL